jgi:glycine betaine transporter
MVVLILIFVFLVTSVDSGTYVLGMFAANGALHPSVTQRLFWGSVIALVTAGVLTQGNSIDFFRAIAVIGAIPYLLVMLLQALRLVAALRRDAYIPG